MKLIKLLGCTAGLLNLNYGFSAEIISITSKGDTLANVTYDLFKKAEKNFVLDTKLAEQAARMPLYLNLKNVSFNTVIQCIQEAYPVSFELTQEIYHVKLSTTVLNQKPLITTTQPLISQEPTLLYKPLPEPELTQDQKTSLQVKTSTFSQPTQLTETPEPSKRKTHSISTKVLQKTITIRMKRADLRTVMNHLGKQGGISIEIDSSVPKYKLDAFLIKTSLGYALREITRQTKLAYECTPHGTLRIFVPQRSKKS